MASVYEICGWDDAAAAAIASLCSRASLAAGLGPETPAFDGGVDADDGGGGGCGETRH